MKVTLSELKKFFYKEPTVRGMKLRTKSMIWNIKEEINSQPEQNEETNI